MQSTIMNASVEIVPTKEISPSNWYKSNPLNNIRDMKTTHYNCDIKDMEHTGEVDTHPVRVIFDHDQEDGKSKTRPYFEDLNIEMCDGCWNYMLEKRRYLYAFGAMGNNTYYLND